MARRAVAVLLVGLAVTVQTWIFARYGSFNLDRIGSEDPAYHSDFDTFWRSADALLRGADIYRTGAGLPNLNPPLLTVMMTPFGLLEILPSYRLFVLVTVCWCSGACSWWPARCGCRPSTPGSRSAPCRSGLRCWRPSGSGRSTRSSPSR